MFVVFLGFALCVSLVLFVLSFRLVRGGCLVCLLVLLALHELRLMYVWRVSFSFVGIAL